MNTREQVWLEAWKAVMSSDANMSTISAQKCADACLKDFDERFPQKKCEACGYLITEDKDLIIKCSKCWHGFHE